jgi:hypothetical protein
VSPVGIERCHDGIDNDCDGRIDDDSSADAVTWYPDIDGDGYGLQLSGIVSCTRPDVFLGAVTFVGGDCNDADTQQNPSIAEVCDGVDNNCRDGVDEGSALDAGLFYGDLDDDGAGDLYTTITACSPPPGFAAGYADCNDLDATVPAAEEVCNGVDDTCEGRFYRGGPMPLATSEQTFQGLAGAGLGEQVFLLPDVDGDGRPTLAMRDADDALYLRHAEARTGFHDLEDVLEGGTREWDHRIVSDEDDSGFGTTSVVADFTGDGIPDLIVGAPDGRGSSRPGLVYLFAGPLGREVQTANATSLWVGTDTQADLGAALATADVDGDGDLDLFVGEPGTDRVHLLTAPLITGGNIADVATLTLQGEASSRFGAALAIADGSLVVGAPTATVIENGHVQRYDFDGTLLATLQGDGTGDKFGFSLASIGDTDGDGAADLAVGTASGNQAWVVSADFVDGGVATVGTAIVEGRFFGRLGRTVAAAGDVDGDGLGDWVVSDKNEDFWAESGGVAYLIYGSPTLPAAFGVGDIESRGRLDGVGTRSFGNAGGVHGAVLYGAAGDAVTAVAAGQDVDGDGHPDLLIGAPGAADGAGQVHVVLAGPYGLDLLVDGSPPTDAPRWFADADADGVADDLIPFASCPVHVPMIFDPVSPTLLAVPESACDSGDTGVCP